MLMRITLVVAMSENRVIGRGNQLPWHLPADLAHFKRLTTGHCVIMGRRTFDSIRAALPKRTNIVITRQAEWNSAGVLVAHDLDEALGLCGDADEAFVVGGEAIFRLALPRADRIHL